MHTKILQRKEQNPNGIVVIRGATATGKTALSVALASYMPLEVISADSRQVYRQMNIGTDKISSDITTKIPHHLIDIVDPDQIYTAGQRKTDATKHIYEVQSRQHTPVIVGGTGLYIDTIYRNFALSEVPPQQAWRDEMMLRESEQAGFLFSSLQKIDPLEAQKHHPNSLRYVLRALEIYEMTGKTKTELSGELPVAQPLYMLGLWRDREETNKRINLRIKEMLHGGLIEEVRSLLDIYGPNAGGMQAIGYKEIIGYIQGTYNLDKAEEILKRNSHHLAKKQRTRFRRYIAEGVMTPKANVTYHVEML